MPFYAVRVGRTPGIYREWSECETQVKGFVKAQYKKFDTEEEAQKFMDGNPNVKCATADSSEGDGSSGQSCSDSSDGASVYLHGCCYSSNAAFGIYWGPDHKNNICERVGGKQSNNKAEICGATKAIQQATSQGIKKLTIHSENKFLIQCATQWMEGWKKKGWKKAGGEEIANKEELQELDAATKDITVTYIHIDSKSKNDQSEAAKKLAGAGTKKKLEGSAEKAEKKTSKRSHSSENSDDSETGSDAKKKPADDIEG